MTLQEIASVSSGCGGGAANTGQLGCKLGFGFVQHAIGLKKGTIIPKGTDIDLDYFNGLVQDGTAIPLMYAFNSEPTINDDTLETSPLGVEAVTLKGLHKYTLTFKEGEYFYKEIAKLKGYGNLDFILGDTEGNWLFAKNSSGDYKGFSAGQVNIKDMPATASETRKRQLSFQLINRQESDLYYDIVVASVFFPIYDVLGINGTILSFADANGAVPPADGQTTLKVKAVLPDGISGIEGLVVGNFAYTQAGSTVVPSAITDDGDGYYTLTVVSISAAQALTLQLYDGSANKNVIISNGILYRSNILTATVTA